MSKPPVHAHDSSVDPAERRATFTIHVRPGPNGPLSGRITHAASGEASYFDTADELVRFLVAKTSRQT
jgi:hypothetical protein